MPYTNLAATKNVFWKMLEYYGQNPSQKKILNSLFPFFQINLTDGGLGK